MSKDIKMLIHECGEIIRCTKIKFEDNKLDLEQYHPGIILLPFITSKEKNYYNVLIKLYDKINKINFSKLDLNNPNNDLRNAFLATARNHYLLNTNMLFEDIALIRRMENPEDRSSNLIMDFIKLEKKREEDKANARARKSYERDCKATQKKIDIAKQKMDIRRESRIQKYGQFDFDI